MSLSKAVIVNKYSVMDNKRIHAVGETEAVLPLCPQLPRQIA